MDGLSIDGYEKLGTGTSNQGIEGYEGGPLGRRRPAFGWNANEQEEEEISHVKHFTISAND